MYHQKARRRVQRRDLTRPVPITSTFVGREEHVRERDIAPGADPPGACHCIGIGVGAPLVAPGADHADVGRCDGICVPVVVPRPSVPRTNNTMTDAHTPTAFRCNSKLLAYNPRWLFDMPHKGTRNATSPVSNMKMLSDDPKKVARHTKRPFDNLKRAAHNTELASDNTTRPCDNPKLLSENTRLLADNTTNDARNPSRRPDNTDCAPAVTMMPGGTRRDHRTRTMIPGSNSMTVASTTITPDRIPVMLADSTEVPACTSVAASRCTV
jgi:hypothetical protein